MSDYANIPDELRTLKRWVCWRFETRNGKRTKPPWSAVTNTYASSTNPATWCDYEQAVTFAANEGIEGIGFVFTPDDGIVGVDLDKTIDESNIIQPWAQEIVDAFNTYTEKSPSGTGLHLLIRGAMPGATGRKVECEAGAIEMYNCGRYFTVTGETISDCREIVTHQPGIDWLYDCYFRSQDSTPILPPAEPRAEAAASNEDAEIVAKLRRSFKWRDIFDGKWQRYYGSQSQADMGLTSEIQKLVGNDPARIERIFRLSKLTRPKYDRPDYRNRTIGKAMSNPTPPKPRSNGQATPKPQRSAQEDCDDVEHMIDSTIDGTRSNIPWMWPRLTHAARCLLPGSITVLCGGAGSAKSLFITHATLDWMAQDLPFAVYHLEEDKAFHLARVWAQLANDSRVTLDDWMRENPDATRELWAQCKEPVGRMASKITDAPQTTITLPDLLDWQVEKLKAGCRILVIDPITAADPGGDQWTADRDFVNDSKRLMREYKASLIVVTHPRGGQKAGDRLDQIAGGRAYNRFTSSVLWLESREPEIMTVMGDMGQHSAQVNRIIQIWKARSGPGSGWNIGYYFDPKTLKFKEQGVIVKDKKK